MPGRRGHRGQRQNPQHREQQQQRDQQQHREQQPHREQEQHTEQQQHREQQQQREEQQQQRLQEHQHQQPKEPPQQQQRQQTPKDISDEAQRRLRLCSANVLDVAKACMHGPHVRISASQRIADRKRFLLVSWTPTSNQPPTASPVDGRPALEFTSASGRYTAQIAQAEEGKEGLRPAASQRGSFLSPYRLEVWGAAGSGGVGCSLCIQLPHGVPWSLPYGGGSFCSGDENLFLYVAESGPSEGVGPLDRFVYKETWGEQLQQHSSGVVIVGSMSPAAVASIRRKGVDGSYCQASFVPDGSAVVCTEFTASPYKLGLKYCVNRRSSVLMAYFPNEDISGALRRSRSLEGDVQRFLSASWLYLSGEEDWAAWGPRVCEPPSACQEPLLTVDIAYLALADNPKERRPHFGNVRLRIARVTRKALGASWVVESRRTVLGLSFLSDPERLPDGSGIFNGDEPIGVSLCCVAGPSRDSSNPAEVKLRPFKGLCCQELPRWTSQGFILTNALIGCRETIIAVRTTGEGKGPVVRPVVLEKPQGPLVPADVKTAAAAAAVGNMVLRDVNGPYLLIQASSPVHVPILVFAKIREPAFGEAGDPQEALWGSPLVADILDALSLRGPADAFEGGVKKLQLHMSTLSLYYLDCQRHWLVRLAKPPKGPSAPSLAVLIHGGPHSCLAASYSREALFFTALGFDVLAVNYRGSAGFGQDELVSLHGHVGQQDVQDVARTVKEVIKQFGYDERRCVAVGGSHGGFLCCHLLGQFPKLFRAASTRNPATYMPGIYAASDIPDFAFAMACGDDFVFGKTPSDEALLRMQQLSPTQFVDSVEAPIIIALGGDDQRVPPSQGLLFWKLLNAHGKQARLLWYSGDVHSLDNPISDADYWANTGAWFLQHLSLDSLPPL